MDVEFAVETLGVGAHGVFGDTTLLGDAGHGVAHGDELQRKGLHLGKGCLRGDCLAGSMAQVVLGGGLGCLGGLCQVGGVLATVRPCRNGDDGKGARHDDECHHEGRHAQGFGTQGGLDAYCAQGRNEGANR